MSRKIRWLPLVLQRQTLFFFVALLAFSPLVRAEHVIQLRGVINVEGLKGALLEIDHFAQGNTNAFRPYIGSNRFIREGERIEDTTTNATSVFVDLIKVDTENKRVTLRDGGIETNYTIPFGQGTYPGETKFALANVPVNDACDIYSMLSGREVLCHPKLESQIGTISLTSNWSSPPSKTSVAKVLETYLRNKGTAVIPDGQRFVMIVLNSEAKNATPRSNKIAGEKPTIEPFELKDTDAALNMYSRMTGERETDKKASRNSRFHFRAMRPMSKSEVLYAIETIFAWNGLTIAPGANQTFRVVQDQNIRSN